MGQDISCKMIQVCIKKIIYRHFKCKIEKKQAKILAFYTYIKAAAAFGSF